ncbi:MAG: squalene/phytoene synthase family protein, partial [Pseudomonadota bacterium]|nr:squalene/phytoene synthase family protein [Pseudomonadota bacterium]
LEYRINPHDLLNARVTDRLHEMLGFQAQRARRYYQRAMSHLPPADRYAQRSGLIMAEIYRTLLDEMEADEFRVMQQRLSLTPLRKLWIAWRTARKEHRWHHKQLKYSARA